MDFEGQEEQITQHLTGKGFQVLSTEEYNNQIATARQEEGGRAAGNAYKETDTAVLAATGVAKKPNEKTSDYVARAFSEKEVEFKAAGGDKTEVAELKKKLEKIEQERETERGQAIQREMTAQAITDIKSLSLRSDISPEDTFEFLKLKATPELVDGQLVFKDSSGQPLVGKDNKPLTASELVKIHAKGFIKPAAEAQGGTGGNPQQQGNATPKGDYLGDTRAEIRDNLRKMGHAMGSPEYKDKLAKALPFAKDKDQK